MIPELDTPERVHYAMLRGTIPRITMMQCAHTWGAKAVAELNYADQLRGDLKLIGDVLWEFGGDHPWQQAQAAVEHITWLRDQLKIAETHERAAMAVAEQDRKELQVLRNQLRRARLCMEANDHLNARDIFGPPIEGVNHDEKARQASGIAGAQQERTQDEGFTYAP